MLENPEALKKMTDEWNGLTEQGTFEFGIVKNPLIFEYDSIRNEARSYKEEIHFGRLMESWMRSIGSYLKKILEGNLRVELSYCETR